MEFTFRASEADIEQPARLKQRGAARIFARNAAFIHPEQNNRLEFASFGAVKSGKIDAVITFAKSGEMAKRHIRNVAFGPCAVDEVIERHFFDG